MDIIAHRGFAAEHPENTLPAFEVAAADADAIEFDVRQTKDGQLVVFHDETVDRVTNQTAPLASYTYDDLQSLSVLNSEAGIPRLDEVVDVVPTETILHVELKEAAALDPLLDWLATVDHDVVLSSFERVTLREARDRLPFALQPDIPRAEIIEDASLARVRAAAHNGAEYIHPQYDLCLNTPVVDWAHEYDLTVNAWTVRDADLIAPLEEAGVDGIITDIRP